MQSFLRVLGRQTWLRFGVRNRIVRFFQHPDKCPDENFEVSFHGLKYEGNLTTYIDWNVFYFGSYCSEELKLFGDLLAWLPKGTALDVGANVGHHTLFLSTVAETVYCFEPLDLVAAKIDRKIAINQINNVHVCKFALGANNETIGYSMPTSNNTGTGSFLAKSEDPSNIRQLPVRVGDEAIKENGIKKVDFVKIDTEGFEQHVLAGLQHTLIRDRPVVFFEWSDEYGRDAADLDELFPTKYVFLKFVSDIPFGLFFRMSNYRLLGRSSKQQSDNLLAVPEEFVLKVTSNRAPSPSARRLAIAFAQALKR